MQGIDPFAVPAGFQSPLYPFSGYDNSRQLDHDVSMMKEMYPLLVRQILLEIEKECDKLEYEGSFMFDEIPDKTLILMLSNKIYNRVAPAFSNESIQDEMESASLRRRPSPPPPPPPPRPQGPNRPCHNNHDCRRDGSPDWLSGLINVLLCSEMCDRRRRYRRRKNMFLF